MWIRMRKELGILAMPPSQVLGLALIIVLLGQWNVVSTLASACWLLSFAIASRLFGAEFDDRTLPRLLAQPISRSRIWGEKILAGATLIAACGGILLVAYMAVRRASAGPLEIFESWHWMIPLVALATGPTVSLWLRDSLRTFWASMALPAAVYFWVLVSWTLIGAGSGLSTAWILIVYSALMLALGYRRFLSLEIAGNETSATRPVTTSRPALAPTRAPRPLGLLRELVLKELRLQRTGLMMIPLVVACWLILWLLSFRADMPLAGGGTLGELLTALGYLPPLVLAMIVPALLGAGAVASERQLGVISWQLALPASRRLQWRLKVAVSALLALLSGLLIVALDRVVPITELEDGSIAELTPWFVLMSLLAYTAGLFGSRHARGSFQSLGLALIFGVCLWLGWGLLRFTSSVAATLWPFTFAAVLNLGAPRTGGLVSIVIGLVLLAVAWVTPRQEEWIAGGKLKRGLASAAVIAGTCLAVQLLLLTWTGQQLEREIAAKDAEIQFLGGLSNLDWLARVLQLPGRPLSVDELPKILDLTIRIAPGSPFSQYFNHHGVMRQPESRFMNLTVWVDGVSTYKLDRWYWMRDRRGLLFSGYTDAQPIDGVITLRGAPFRWRAFSIAPLWFQGKRRAQLDRRVRQNVSLEAIRTGRLLARLEAYDLVRYQQVQYVPRNSLQQMAERLQRAREQSQPDRRHVPPVDDVEPDQSDDR